MPRVLDSDLDDLGETARRWAVEAESAGAHKTVVAHGQWKAAVAAYLACVSFVDAQLGRLLDALDASPHRDNTVIALWGDHGWHLGEKQHWGKWTGWERATRVPLIIAPALSNPPGPHKGEPCNRPVSLVDLFPTLVDLCGLPAPGGLDGLSLVPLLKDPNRETRPVVTTFDYENYSVRTDRWRLIHYEDGSEEFYDHAADPDEWRNLSTDPAHDSTRAFAHVFAGCGRDPSRPCFRCRRYGLPRRLGAFGRDGQDLPRRLLETVLPLEQHDPGRQDFFQQGHRASLEHQRAVEGEATGKPVV